MSRAQHLVNFFFLLFIFTITCFSKVRAEENTLSFNTGMIQVDEYTYDVVIEAEKNKSKQKFILQCDKTSESLSFFYYVENSKKYSISSFTISSLNSDGTTSVIFDPNNEKKSFQQSLIFNNKKENIIFTLYEVVKGKRTPRFNSFVFPGTILNKIIKGLDEAPKGTCDIYGGYSETYPLHFFRSDLLH